MLTPEVRVNTSTFRREGFQKLKPLSMARRSAKNIFCLLLIISATVAVYLVFAGHRTGPQKSAWKGEVQNMHVVDESDRDALEEESDFEGDASVSSTTAAPLGVRFQKIMDKARNFFDGNEDKESSDLGYEDDWGELDGVEKKKGYEYDEDNAHEVDRDENEEYRDHYGDNELEDGVFVHDGAVTTSNKNIPEEHLVRNHLGEVVEEKLFDQGIDPNAFKKDNDFDDRDRDDGNGESEQHELEGNLQDRNQEENSMYHDALEWPDNEDEDSLNEGNEMHGDQLQSNDLWDFNKHQIDKPLEQQDSLSKDSPNVFNPNRDANANFGRNDNNILEGAVIRNDQNNFLPRLKIQQNEQAWKAQPVYNSQEKQGAILRPFGQHGVNPFFENRLDNRNRAEEAPVGQKIGENPPNGLGAFGLKELDWFGDRIKPKVDNQQVNVNPANNGNDPNKLGGEKKYVPYMERHGLLGNGPKPNEVVGGQQQELQPNVAGQDGVKKYVPYLQRHGLMGNIQPANVPGAQQQDLQQQQQQQQDPQQQQQQLGEPDQEELQRKFELQKQLQEHLQEQADLQRRFMLQKQQQEQQPQQQFNLASQQSALQQQQLLQQLLQQRQQQQQQQQQQQPAPEDLLGQQDAIPQLAQQGQQQGPQQQQLGPGGDEASSLERLHIEDLNVPLPIQVKCIDFKFPTRMGPLCIHAGDRDTEVSSKIEREGTYEPEIMEQVVGILTNDASLGLVDIGAGIGVYTITAALMQRKVLAVEPLYRNFRLLHKSALENHVTDQIVLVAQALDNETYAGQMSYSDETMGYSQVHITRLMLGQEIEQDRANIVYVTTLNKLAPAAPFRRALMKLDVNEGMELNILKASSSFFQAIDVPYIITHWSQSEDSERHANMFAQLSFLGYRPRLAWNGADANIELLRNDRSFMVWKQIDL